jgi:hypothetical protein
MVENDLVFSIIGDQSLSFPAALLLYFPERVLEVVAFLSTITNV